MNFWDGRNKGMKMVSWVRQVECQQMGGDCLEVMLGMIKASGSFNPEAFYLDFGL